MVCLGDIFCWGPGASPPPSCSQKPGWGAVGPATPGRDFLVLVADMWAERGEPGTRINPAFLAGKCQ